MRLPPAVGCAVGGEQEGPTGKRDGVRSAVTHAGTYAAQADG